MKKDTKKRAKSMLPAIKKLISRRALRELDKGREKLADELREEIQEQYPEEVTPAWETVIKRISKARNHESGPEDTPWHLGALNDYPIQAEAIPAILDVQNWSEFQKQKQSINKDDTWLTFNHFDTSIRQAYWIARLYALIDWSKAKKNKKSLERSLYWLWTWSKVYTLEGMICWLSGIDLDTSKIDKALREGWSAYVLGYEYFLAPQEKNMPGIMNTLSNSYSADDSLPDIIKNQSEVNNERTHNATK